MQIFARIAGDQVAELVEIPDGVALAEAFHPDIAATMVPVPDGAAVAVGHGWDGTDFTPPAAPAPLVPGTITRRQLLLGLVGAGLIAEAEALAAATAGAVPAAIDAIFAQLPPAEALAARVTWATMTVVERDNPLVLALIAAGLADAGQVDALFTTAATL